ncbi:MAG: FHA domain-containing protein [Planctomycetes bacterium]|nr:FHA domain-containing protein [Planctomycetota bacterium]
MNLVVKQSGMLVKDLRFARGPVYIGRQLESQVCLPDLAVSREHTVIYGADDAKWFVEDLNSANKTYLNKNAVHKSELKDGDVLQIANFTIEVQMGGGSEKARQLSMTDTMRPDVHTPETIVRRYEAKDAPAIRFDAAHAKSYLKATSAILNTSGPDELLKVLMTITADQFGAFHNWIGLRIATTGELTHIAGHKSTGQDIKLDEMIFGKMITDAMNRAEYTLIPLLPKDKQYERIRSGLITPVESDAGCHGVIYVDNAVDRTHFSLTDLDYLVLLAVQAGVMLGKFK